MRQMRTPTGTSTPGLTDPAKAPPVRALGVEVDPLRRAVSVDGRSVSLTDQEYRLLYLFVSNAGTVFSRDAILEKIWGTETFVTVRSVDTLVKRVRRRIETDPAQPRFVLTLWGIGYKFADV
jgi:DNA-binding response OmpR family regulator